MRISLNKKKDKSKNKWWFSWRPIIAERWDGARYIVWWEDVWRANTMGLITYHLASPKRGRMWKTNEDVNSTEAAPRGDKS